MRKINVSTVMGLAYFAQVTGLDFTSVRGALQRATWEHNDDGTGMIRRAWLGTVFGLTPSGKVYAPFACSNVAGDCPICSGTGKRPEPRTGKRVRARARHRAFTLARASYMRRKDGNAAPFMARVRDMRDRAHHMQDDTCLACHGEGSISAARDTRWQERLEMACEQIGAFVDCEGEDIYVCETRDYLEGEESDFESDAAE